MMQMIVAEIGNCQNRCGDAVLHFANNLCYRVDNT